LWAIGRYELGLSEADFWRLTMRQFDALRKLAQDVQDRADIRAGLIAATIANCTPFKEARSFTPADFFPSLAKYYGHRRHRKRLTGEEWLAKIGALHKEMTGETIPAKKIE
jgi:hypothetical protein